MKCSECPEPELLEENETAVALFNRSTTQFRHGFSGPTGLDYAGVEKVANAMKIDLDAQFENLQIMEYEYLAIVSESRAKDDEK